MKAKKSNRRIAREKSLQILYALEMNNDEYETIVSEILQDIKEVKDKEFCISIVKKVVKEYSALDKLIEGKAKNWDFGRLALIDRLLLRIGITEILHFSDIPPKVTINEMIEISKEFSTSKSGKFINGILDSILSDLKSDNQLKKSGRGLLEESLQKKSGK